MSGHKELYDRLSETGGYTGIMRENWSGMDRGHNLSELRRTWTVYQRIGGAGMTISASESGNLIPDWARLEGIVADNIATHFGLE